MCRGSDPLRAYKVDKKHGISVPDKVFSLKWPLGQFNQ